MGLNIDCEGRGVIVDQSVMKCYVPSPETGFDGICKDIAKISYTLSCPGPREA